MRSERPTQRVGLLLSRLVFRLALLGALVPGFTMTSAAAAGRGVPDPLTVERAASDLDVKISEIQRNFTERSGLIGATDARDRYAEGVYQYLVGDYANAASSFYILVNSQALGTPDLARDSEWYLAECLFELGNYRIAVESYRAIVEAGSAHPYFPDAARRSLETYAILGDNKGFDAFYNAYIVSGKVKSTELISYTLAKSFFRRGEDARTKAMFEAIAPNSAYYSRARYFLGVQMIKEGNLTQALTEFMAAEKDPVIDDEHKRVHELAQLAIARLYYEAGDTAQATVWYGKVSKGSPNFADQLYESAWALIRQANDVAEAREKADIAAAELALSRGEKEIVDDNRLTPDEAKIWSAAAVQVTLFLEQFPQHRETASMKLHRGHLQMKLRDYDEAEVNYQKVVAEYEPVVNKLSEIEGDQKITARFLDELSDDKKAASEDLLPGYAEELLLSRSDVRRASDAWGELQSQRAELAESDQLVATLNAAMGKGTNRLGNFVTARQQLEGLSDSVASLQRRVVDAEILAIRSADPSSRSDMTALQKRCDKAFEEDAGGADNARMVATLVDLRNTLRGYRSKLSDAAPLVGIDKLWTTVSALQNRLTETQALLVASEAREMSAVQKSLEFTTAKVSVLHTEVANQTTKVDGLARLAVQQGVHAVADTFRNDVLTADKGIVDVAWLRKGATTDQMELLTKEQQALMKSIKEQYANLRTNADQGGGQ